MYSLNAAGIAAIQVGRLERIFVLDGKVPAGGDDNSPRSSSSTRSWSRRARASRWPRRAVCSFPGVYVDIKRPRWAKVRARDLDGNTVEVDGDGLLGRALQHEHDHLTGKLMIDLVGTIKKEVIKRKMKRWHADHDGEKPAATTPSLPELV